MKNHQACEDGPGWFVHSGAEDFGIVMHRHQVRAGKSTLKRHKGT